MRADSGFYTHAIVPVCRKLNVRFSITIRQHQSLRKLTLAIPEADWTPVPLQLSLLFSHPRSLPDLSFSPERRISPTQERPFATLRVTIRRP